MITATQEGLEMNRHELEPAAWAYAVAVGVLLGAMLALVLGEIK